MTDQTPWCCTGRVFECPLCPQYGTSLLDPCPGHAVNDNTQTVVDTARLHAERRHPGYEYATTTGPRKQWDDADVPPHGDNGEPDTTWQPNLDAGHPGTGWERFDYTEEAYWRRPKTAATRVCIHPEGYEGECPCPPNCGCCKATEATERAKPPLREQIAAALYEKSNPGYRWADAHPDDVLAYGTDADAALKVIEGHLDIGEAEAWCKTCRRVWDGPRHQCESDAEAAVTRVRALHSRDRQGRCSYCTWLDDQAGSGLDVSYPCDTVRALDQPQEQA